MAIIKTRKMKLSHSANGLIGKARQALNELLLFKTINLSFEDAIEKVTEELKNEGEQMKTFTVGQLAQKAQVNIETIRFYEKRKLMPKPIRTESGYRQYAAHDVTRILFIKRAKELGFTLKEISELLSLKIDDETTCGDVKLLAETKLLNVEEKIRDLKKIKKKLEELVVQCINEHNSTSACPIIEALDQTENK